MKDEIYYENNSCIVYKLDWMEDRYHVCYKNNLEENFYTNKAYLEKHVINNNPRYIQLSLFD